MSIKYFILSVLAIILLYGCNEQDSININKCKQLRVGMSYDEVIKIMGVPGKVNEYGKDGKNLKRIYYEASSLASSKPSCLFDAHTNILIEVSCSDKD